MQNLTYRVIELESGDERAGGILQPRDAEVQFRVRGAFTVESNAIEYVAVRIDGLPYPIPEATFGRRLVKFEDMHTVPPPPKPAGAAKDPSAKAPPRRR
jgi:hypothetical protein